MKECVLLLSILLGADLSAASLQIAPTEGSRMALTVEKTGLMRGRKHLFLFPKFQGTLDFDATRTESGQVHLQIESASAECKDDWVSMKDLRKIQETALEDMLAARKYPQITFVSKSVRSSGGNQYEVTGTLTIRDVSKDAVVMVELDSRDPARVKLTGQARVLLTQFGLKPPTAILGAIGTKDEMTLNFQLEARMQ